MRIFYNVKLLYTIYLKFSERFFTSLTMAGLEAKASICSGIEENLTFILP